MMRAKTGFSVNAIFITHWHADHYLGIFGLVETMAFNGRTEPLTVYGPSGVEGFIDVVRILTPKIPFVLTAVPVLGGDVIMFDGYSVVAFKTYHGVESVGYVLEEDMRPGRFNREGAISLGVPPGPLFGKLQRGESVRVVRDGIEVEITPKEVMGERRRGRKVVYTGDTRPVKNQDDLFSNADLLIHEATFDDEEGLARAKEVWHSTAREAGKVAARVCPQILALVHFSSRYTNSANHIRDAREEFEGEVIAPQDLTMVEILFRDE